MKSEKMCAVRRTAFWVPVLGGAALGVGVGVGVGQRLVDRYFHFRDARAAAAAAQSRVAAAAGAVVAAPAIPSSKLPGPPRDPVMSGFVLDESNAVLMTGTDDAANERWADIAGNYYATAFISRFSYERPGPEGPRVLVRVDPEGKTLRGRLEARGLKPNFAYQIKLRGVFSDRVSFERIGYAGRWRLPGRGTNYTDADYRGYARKQDVEAYILFDYFVTDARGDAIREFALDSSLHVLFNGSRQHQNGVAAADLLPHEVIATDGDTYALPKAESSVEWMWAERERARYRSAGDITRLPPGPYRAELVLTEESLHARDNDGGFWATVMVCPVGFRIVE